MVIRVIRVIRVINNESVCLDLWLHLLIERKIDREVSVYGIHSIYVWYLSMVSIYSIYVWYLSMVSIYSIYL